MSLQRITKDALENNAVDVAKLDATDGNSGELLSTNGSGGLSFIPQLISLAVGGDLTGTTDNAVIAAGSVEDSMIVAMNAAKLTGILPAISGANLTGISTNIKSVLAAEPSQGNGVRTITGLGFQPIYVLVVSSATNASTSPSMSIGFGTPTLQQCVWATGASYFKTNTGMARLEYSDGNTATKTMSLSSFDSDGLTYSTGGSANTNLGWSFGFTIFG